MLKLRRNREGNPDVPTSAMPDIIFILIFFFMMTTELRTKPVLVKFEMTEATQLKEFDRTTNKFYIYIGPPKDPGLGVQPKVQLNGKLVSPTEVPKIINEMVEELEEDKQDKAQIFVFLTVDKDADMGLVTDVKQMLKEVDTRNVVYKALPVEEAF